MALYKTTKDKKWTQLGTILHILYTRSLLSHVLVYNGGFSNFELLLLVRNSSYLAQNFVWPQLLGMIYFHKKIWNHSVIYSYFGYICHYTPVTLLLSCHNVKDWSIGICHAVRSSSFRISQN